jgi:hypothetical protein
VCSEPPDEKDESKLLRRPSPKANTQLNFSSPAGLTDEQLDLIRSEDLPDLKVTGIRSVSLDFSQAQVRCAHLCFIVTPLIDRQMDCWNG